MARDSWYSSFRRGMFAVEKRLPSRARVSRTWVQRASIRTPGVGFQPAVAWMKN